jgi:hypothetical protein
LLSVNEFFAPREGPFIIKKRDRARYRLATRGGIVAADQSDSPCTSIKRRGELRFLCPACM